MRIGGDARSDLVGRPRADRTQEQTGCRPVIVWQSDTLTRLLQSVLVVPLTSNLDRARLAGTALVAASDGGLVADSVALAFQMRAVPRKSLKTLIRALTSEELAEALCFAGEPGFPSTQYRFAGEDDRLRQDSR